MNRLTIFWIHVLIITTILMIVSGILSKEPNLTYASMIGMGGALAWLIESK